MIRQATAAGAEALIASDRLMGVALVRASEIGIERLQLSMRGDNVRAKALYDSLGFEVESVKTRFVKLPDGTYVDDLTMVRFLA